jgi:hypothetical protein
MKNLLFCITLTFALLASCSSKNSDEMSNAELLTLGIWTRTLDFENKNGTFVEYGFDCYKDNRWEFKADGKVIYDDGPVDCDPDTPPVDPIELGWVLEGNDQQLIIQFPFDEAKYSIVELNGSKLVMDEIEPGTANTITNHRVILER